MSDNILIKDYKHEMGAHCETTVARNLLSYNGLELSEPMIFGIGSGLFFSHLSMYKIGGVPVTSFRPWPGLIFKRLCKEFNIQMYRKTYKDEDLAMQELDQQLKKGIPTALTVGMFNLDYMPKAFRFHFNAHNIIVYGKQDDNYLVSEPIFEKEERISYDALKRSRFAKGTFHPNGKLYYVKNVPDNCDVKKAVINGIDKTSKLMVGVPGYIVGTKGIKHVAKKVKNYPDKLGDKLAIKNLAMLVRMQEEIGTGGAGFRFMYAAFLQESAALFENTKLDVLSEQMTKNGDLWRQFAYAAGRIVKNRNIDETYNSISDMLLEISENEYQIFSQLRKIDLKNG